MPSPAIATYRERPRRLWPGWRRVASAWRRQHERRRVATRRRMIRFLWSHLRGYRLLVGLAIGLTFLAVGTEILMTFPFKFMLDKIVHHQDPNIPMLGGLLGRFDALGNRNSLLDNEVH